MRFPSVECNALPIPVQGGHNSLSNRRQARHSPRFTRGKGRKGQHVSPWTKMAQNEQKDEKVKVADMTNMAKNFKWAKQGRRRKSGTKGKKGKK